MIHYHGLPITPATAAAKAIEAGHAFVSFAHPDQLSIAMDVAQSFAIDNGAFSAWRAGKPIADWSEYHAWVSELSFHPSFDFACIPDVIDGTEEENNALINAWPFKTANCKSVGAPVWHMHESMHKLRWLAREFPRVCLGSSGEFAEIGTSQWWQRMSQAMKVVCDDNGRPTTKLHGLRMLDPEIFTRLPLSSADSTNIGRNIGIDQTWRGNYMPPTKEMRAAVMRSRIEAHNAAHAWTMAVPEQVGLI